MIRWPLPIPSICPDQSGSREGGGVYRSNRKLADINRGYIDYSGA